MRRLRVRSGAAVVLIVLGVAAALTATGTRLAVSQEAVLTAKTSSEPVPAKDPWSSFWNQIPKVDVPLSAQSSTPPMGGRGLTLSARAVQDATNVYVLVEWPDTSAERSLGRTQDFTDAAAVQFPAVVGTSVPAFCMGDPNATVNIWQWKAAWQADVLQGFQGHVKDTYPNTAVDEYPFHDDPVFYPGRAVHNPFSRTDRHSAVDNLVAGGFGSLTADPLGSVTGWGAWQNGTWRVVFSRPLQVGRDGNVELHSDDWTNVAFAVWDGAAQERDGMKSVANFVSLDLNSQRLTPSKDWGPWGLYVALAFWLLLVVLIVGALPGRD